MKEMCETIVRADLLQYPDGRKPTAEQIFNYSPIGELAEVFYWYEAAKEVLKAKEQNGIHSEG